MKIVLVSREVYPLASGGIGEFVSSAAALLSRIAEVTVLTSSRYEQLYERLRAEADPRLPPAGVRVAFVPEPAGEELAGWYDVMQCYGDRVLRRLRELFPDGGPDLIEFPDFLAEGFVTLQAARALEPFLQRTTIAVRIHTSAEVTEVLNGHYHRDLGRQVVYAMERYCLTQADRVIWPLGDVLGTYRRFYRDERLAPAVKIGYPYSGSLADPAGDADYEAPPRLRLLFVGRLERRKGVTPLVGAARGLDREDFRLTLVGSDTHTAPLGLPMRHLLELSLADDTRIQLRDQVDHRALGAAIRAHDVVVVPSRWECGPYVALEALAQNRPVLAPAAGGLAEIVVPGQTGWLAQGSDRSALAAAIERLLDSRDELTRIIRSGQLVARAKSLCDERAILDAYAQLAQLKPRPTPRTPRKAPPLVSAIVPYYRSAAYVRATVDSLLAQTHPRLEIVLVNDGSFEDEDAVVAELASRLPLTVVSQVNSGLGAARNLGISLSRGRYFFPLDSDNFAHPEFVERCVSLLERRPQLAYVSSWSRYVQEDGSPRPGPLGYQPLGNYPERLLAMEDVAGDAAAVIPRRLFDLGFRYRSELTACEDWHFYRELARQGHFGAIVPERLLYYRVRADSMQAEFGIPHRERILGEIDALLREQTMQWTAVPAR